MQVVLRHSALAIGLLSVVLAVAVACGSSDGKKKSQAAGGEGGGAGEGAETAGAPAVGGAPGSAGQTNVEAGAPTSEGGAAGAPAVIGTDLFVSPTGSDQDPGTLEEPFLTIAHAASVAAAGDRIQLLDGTFDETTEPSFGQAMAVEIPAGVSVVAVNAGQVTLDGANANTSRALSFLGAGALSGVAFQDFAAAIAAEGGTFDMEGISLVNCGNPSQSPIELSGDVVATLQPGESQDYVGMPGGYYFATLNDQAALSVQGGRVAGLQTGAVNGRGTFHVLDEASLTLSNVLVEDLPAETIFASGTASVTLEAGTTIDGTLTPASAVVELQGSAALVMNQATISNSYWAGISTIGSGSVELTDSEISTSGSWAMIINAPGPVAVTLVNSVLTGSVTSNIDVRAGADFDISGCQITDSNQFGMILGSGDAVHLTMRDTSVTGNFGGIQANSGAGSTCDLGTVDSPGGNDFSGNGSMYPGVGSYLSGPAVVYAVGNTWNPNEQAANAQGRYTVVGAGATLDVSAQVISGLNYRLFGVGSSIRLAENP